MGSNPGVKSIHNDVIGGCFNRKTPERGEMERMYLEDLSRRKSRGLLKKRVLRSYKGIGHDLVLRVWCVGDDTKYLEREITLS